MRARNPGHGFTLLWVWQKLVVYSGMSSGLRLYIWLAGASLGTALLWQHLVLPASSPQGFAIHFYQHVLGRIDGRPCPSYPVCSLYARQALHEHGLLLGSWLIVDRLIHEGGDLQGGSWRIIEGEKRLYDPLWRNDFWMGVK
jgi:putative component of membrane protein insertase Oxa1/YidC/SpoIIIJ protein YidD